MRERDETRNQEGEREMEMETRILKLVNHRVRVVVDKEHERKKNK